MVDTIATGYFARIDMRTFRCYGSLHERRTNEAQSMKNFDDRTPIYRQIADQITRDILGGSIAEEDQVMSTNQYAAFYRINPATAAKAFQHLVDENILYKRRGIGMFVSTGARKQLQDEHRKQFFTSVVTHLIEEAKTLGIPLEEVVKYLQTVKSEETR